MRDQRGAGEVAGRSRVMSDCRVSTVTAAPSAAGAGTSPAASASSSVSRSCTTQCCGPGNQRREPATHRAGAAAEVVDHPRPVASGPRCSTRSRGAGRGVGGLAQREPVPLTGRPGRSSRRPRQDGLRDGCGGSTSRERLAPLARGPSQPFSEFASPSQERSAAASAADVIRRDQQAGQDPSAPWPRASVSPRHRSAITGGHAPAPR